MHFPLKGIWKLPLFTAFILLQTGWVLPEPYQKLEPPKDPGNLLDAVIIEINGQSKKVPSDGELPFVKGDTIKVRLALLKNAKSKSYPLSTEGISRTHELPTNRIIDTSQETIDKSNAVDPAGMVFPIVLRSNQTLHGVVFLHRVEPTLSYADILINGKKVVMREGEKISVKAKDHFKVLKVMTNVPDNKDITFKVIPVSGQSTGPGKNYQITFRHKESIFAKIPLTVEDL